ncbi:MAG TPA: ATP-binding protein [Gaiellaceae bacterium]|nr:ATP-binding protein [Gaiellaceae bacterium]
MPSIRPYSADDLGQILRLWEAAPGGWPSTDASMRLLLDADALCLVADDDGRVVGCGLGVVAAGVGWVCRTDARGDEISVALHEALAAAFAEEGARLIAALSPDGDALAEHGFRRTGAAVFERELVELGTAPALTAVGARLIPVGLWDELRGMDEAKEIIERRVILPLAEPELAARHAVEQPKAIVLFGPPGTGKTTFAKGIASRLAWPFVEIQPSEIGAEGAERQAKLLAETFDRLLDLPEAVVFVDEVEDIASIRHEERRVSPNITNEFLKQIPRMRESPHHLLVCATNSVGMLDPAFLRPGRFDYVLPVGPPNDEARAAIWARYVDEITDEPVVVGVLVEASPLFTPADIEWAARKAAQRAFEREHFAGNGSRATTDDFLAAIAVTRATLTPEMVDDFVADTERFART